MVDRDGADGAQSDRNDATAGGAADTLRTDRILRRVGGLDHRTIDERGRGRRRNVLFGENGWTRERGHGGRDRRTACSVGRTLEQQVSALRRRAMRQANLPMPARISCGRRLIWGDQPAPRRRRDGSKPGDQAEVSAMNGKRAGSLKADADPD